MSEYEFVEMLPPYVAPEHVPLIDEAEKMLKDYCEHLLGRIKNDLDRPNQMLSPSAKDLAAAEAQFMNDPMRLALIKHVVGVRSIYERPRFLAKKTTN